MREALPREPTTEGVFLHGLPVERPGLDHRSAPRVPVSGGRCGPLLTVLLGQVSVLLRRGSVGAVFLLNAQSRHEPAEVRFLLFALNPRVEVATLTVPRANAVVDVSTMSTPEGVGPYVLDQEARRVKLGNDGPHRLLAGERHIKREP